MQLWRWLLNFRVRVFLKSAVKDSKTLQDDSTFSCHKNFTLHGERSLLFVSRDFKQIAMATSTTAMVDAESCEEYVTTAHQISTFSKWHPNSDKGVSRSFAFTASKMQGRCNITGKPETSNIFFIKWKTIYDRFLKNRDCKKKGFYIHVVVTTPQDRSSPCRILRYHERLFPSMRTAVFLGFFTFGRGSNRRSPKRFA